MNRLMQVLMDAVTMMAVADVDYWNARQQFADPDSASLAGAHWLPGVDPERRLGLYGGDSMRVRPSERDARHEEEAALIAADALLAAARDDVVRSN